MPTIDELKQQEKEHLERLIELGYLPDPEQLPDDVRLLFVAHAEKKPWPYKDKDLIEAWRETQEIVTKVKQFAHMEMASKQSVPSDRNEQGRPNEEANYQQKKQDKPKLPNGLSPDLQAWYYIILQAEYETSEHGVTNKNFCRDNGLSLDTFKSNKRKLQGNSEFDIKLWQRTVKSTEDHKRVIKAIKQKREQGWDDEPSVHT